MPEHMGTRVVLANTVRGKDRGMFRAERDRRLAVETGVVRAHVGKRTGQGGEQAVGAVADMVVDDCAVPPQPSR